MIPRMETMRAKTILDLAAFMLIATSVWAGDFLVVGDAVPLTAPGEFYMAAQWSPDGGQLAAAGINYQGLYLIDFPTGTAHPLSIENSAGYGFAWSHDGSRIATRIAHYNKMLRTNTLVSLNVTDGRQLVLSDTRSLMAGTPRWTSDDAQVYLTFADALELFNTGADPGIKDSFFYVKTGRMIRREPLRTTESILFQDQDQVRSYALSPDGSQIAFSTSGQKLWVAQSNGEQVHSLGSGMAPSWSPDGTWITYMLPEDDGHTVLNSDIYVSRADGSSRSKLTDTPHRREMHPQWSPDGDWIVFDTDELGQLFVQQLEWR